MTSRNKDHPSRDKLLERILSRVQSIDRNVEEILDRVSDHFDDVHLHENAHDYRGLSGYDESEFGYEA